MGIMAKTYAFSTSYKNRPLKAWEGPSWALAREATTVGTRVTVVALRGVERGWAIPVAGPVLPATATPAGRRAWGRLLRQGHRAVPRAWTVMVRAERGGDARGRLRRITRLGWPPLWRLHIGGPWRPQGHVRRVALKTLVPTPGLPWQGTGLAFQGRHRQRHGPRLACWEAGDPEPWWRRTALPPEARATCG